jgi:hypothetical protein
MTSCARDLARDCFTSVGVDVTNDDRSFLFSKEQGDLPADTGPSTGNECGLVIQPEHASPILLGCWLPD